MTDEELWTRYAAAAMGGMVNGYISEDWSEVAIANCAKRLADEMVIVHRERFPVTQLSKTGVVKAEYPAHTVDGTTLSPTCQGSLMVYAAYIVPPDTATKSYVDSVVVDGKPCMFPFVLKHGQTLTCPQGLILEIYRV